MMKVNNGWSLHRTVNFKSRNCSDLLWLIKEKEELIRQLNGFFQWPLPFPFTPHKALFYKGIHYYLKFYIMYYWHGRRWQKQTVMVGLFSVLKVSSVWKTHAPTLNQDTGSFVKTDAWLSQLLAPTHRINVYS